MADDDNIDPNETANSGGTEGDDGRDNDDLDTWKSHARKWERTAKANADAVKRAEEAERRLSEIENASKSEREKELDKVRTEAAEEARKDALTMANRRIVKSEVRAAAAGKLADPEDAVRFIDLDDIAVGDDGDVNVKALNDAVARLLKDKPYLGADSGKRKHGDFDQGARGRSGNGTSMNEIIRSKAGRG